MTTKKAIPKKKPANPRKVPLPNLLESNFCAEFIRSTEKSAEARAVAAAQALGLGDEQGPQFLARKAVQQYLHTYQSIFLQYLAESEAFGLLQSDMGREGIAKQYMRLANMSPERTKGSIDGQVNALDSLVALLGLKVDMSKLPAMFGAMTDEQLKAYATPNQTPQ